MPDNEDCFSDKYYAVIKKNERNIFYISELNSGFHKLMDNGRISLDSIISSVSFYEASKNMSSYSENFLYRNGKNIYKYFLTVVPEIKRESVDSISVFLEKNGTIDMVSVLEELTPREKEVLIFALNGFTNKYTANSLCIKEGTVKKLLHNCYQKLSVNSRTELVKLFIFANKN